MNYLYFVSLQPKKQRDAMCQFYETYNGPYLRYRSAVDNTKYLGFNKYGKPIKGQRGRQECFNFMKYNPSFSINDHNDWMTGNAPGDHRRDVIHRKHHHQQQQQQPQQRQIHQQLLAHRTKKNLLQSDEISRELITTHRHRHSNRLKQSHDELAVITRRRQHNNRHIDMSKY